MAARNTEQYRQSAKGLSKRLALWGLVLGCCAIMPLYSAQAQKMDVKALYSKALAKKAGQQYVATVGKKLKAAGASDEDLFKMSLIYIKGALGCASITMDQFDPSITQPAYSAIARGASIDEAQKAMEKRIKHILKNKDNPANEKLVHNIKMTKIKSAMCEQKFKKMIQEKFITNAKNQGKKR